MQIVAIVGPGRVGTALWLALQGHGHLVRAAGGTAASQELFRARTGQAVSPAAADICRTADWIFLTVPDRAIGPLAQELSAAGAFHAGQIVAHTSGALPSATLAPAATAGADVLALHPMQSFARPELGPALFAGVTCSIEGTPHARTAGAEFALALGMRPWQVEAKDKARLHAACSLASNALVALLAVAAGTAATTNDAQGTEVALQALLPLSRGSLENVARLGLPQALTGPVERADLATVRSHLDVLEGSADDVYRALSLVVVELAREKGSLGAEDALALQKMLRR